jgi:uroporphyrinogen-III synthase
LSAHPLAAFQSGFAIVENARFPIAACDGMRVALFVDVPMITSITTSQRPIIALLEARMSSELARLVEKHGGSPLTVPAVYEAPQPATAATHQLLDELARDHHEIVIFMTGVAVALLFETAEQLGRRAELVASLRRVTTLCRGTKPSAALRGFGVPPTLTASEPFTAAETIDALSDLTLAGRRVLLFNYGERSETVAETLLARRAELQEFWLYRWEMPSDTLGLERLVRRIIGDGVDALAITCQIQFRHLHRVAERLELEGALLHALNDRVVVGVVGPTCRAVLESYGVRPHVMPEHPKMGPLVIALMRHLDPRTPQLNSDAPKLA